ncbi:MAG: hypothetical protein C5B50_25210 [Verrucomicrobia bacterium]|nr:MAG: hypothetical protein C5B50_25210 [Verrucomicrobiota bacterium]
MIRGQRSEVRGQKSEVRKLLMKLVCFAVKEEAAPFQKLTGARPECEVLLTGMGRRNADSAIRSALSKSRPELVLTCGFAGGLNPDLAGGTVLFSLDGSVAPTASQSQSASSLEASLIVAGARPCRFHCSDRVACTAEEKRALRKTTSADAVEMESQYICAICREQNILCATVRVVLDTAAEDLPLDFNLLFTPDQKLDYGKLATALLKSPGKLADLLRFQRQTQAAAARLAQVLARCVSELNPQAA